MYRSARACCWKTHKFTPFHTLLGGKRVADDSREGGEEKRRMDAKESWESHREVGGNPRSKFISVWVHFPHNDFSPGRKKKKDWECWEDSGKPSEHSCCSHRSLPWRIDSSSLMKFRRACIFILFFFTHWNNFVGSWRGSRARATGRRVCPAMRPCNNYTALGQDGGQCPLSWGKLQGGSYAK